MSGVKSRRHSTIQGLGRPLNRRGGRRKSTMVRSRAAMANTVADTMTEEGSAGVVIPGGTAVPRETRRASTAARNDKAAVVEVGPRQCVLTADQSSHTQLLREGIQLIKFGRSGKPHYTRVFASRGLDWVLWEAGKRAGWTNKKPKGASWSLWTADPASEVQDPSANEGDQSGIDSLEALYADGARSGKRCLCVLPTGFAQGAGDAEANNSDQGWRDVLLSSPEGSDAPPSRVFLKKSSAQFLDRCEEHYAAVLAWCGLTTDGEFTRMVRADALNNGEDGGEVSPSSPNDATTFTTTDAALWAQGVEGQNGLLCDPLLRIGQDARPQPVDGSQPTSGETKSSGKCVRYTAQDDWLRRFVCRLRMRHLCVALEFGTTAGVKVGGEEASSSDSSNSSGDSDVRTLDFVYPLLAVVTERLGRLAEQEAASHPWSPHTCRFSRHPDDEASRSYATEFPSKTYPEDKVPSCVLLRRQQVLCQTVWDGWLRMQKWLTAVAWWFHVVHRTRVRSHLFSKVRSVLERSRMRALARQRLKSGGSDAMVLSVGVEGGVEGGGVGRELDGLGPLSYLEVINPLQLTRVWGASDLSDVMYIAAGGQQGSARGGSGAVNGRSLTSAFLEKMRLFDRSSACHRVVDRDLSNSNSADFWESFDWSDAKSLAQCFEGDAVRSLVGKTLLAHGVLARKTRISMVRRWLFLFTDCVLICEPGAEKDAKEQPSSNSSSSSMQHSVEAVDDALCVPVKVLPPGANRGRGALRHRARHSLFSRTQAVWNLRRSEDADGEADSGDTGEDESPGSVQEGSERKQASSRPTARSASSSACPASTYYDPSRHGRLKTKQVFPLEHLLVSDGCAPVYSDVPKLSATHRDSSKSFVLYSRRDAIPGMLEAVGGESKLGREAGKKKSKGKGDQEKSSTAGRQATSRDVRCLYMEPNAERASQQWPSVSSAMLPRTVEKPCLMIASSTMTKRMWVRILSVAIRNRFVYLEFLRRAPSCTLRTLYSEDNPMGYSVHDGYVGTQFSAALHGDVDFFETAVTRAKKYHKKHGGKSQQPTAPAVVTHRGTPPVIRSTLSLGCAPDVTQARKDVDGLDYYGRNCMYLAVVSQQVKCISRLISVASLYQLTTPLTAVVPLVHEAVPSMSEHVARRDMLSVGNAQCDHGLPAVFPVDTVRTAIVRLLTCLDPPTRLAHILLDAVKAGLLLESPSQGWAALTYSLLPRVLSAPRALSAKVYPPFYRLLGNLGLSVFPAHLRQAALRNDAIASLSDKSRKSRQGSSDEKEGSEEDADVYSWQIAQGGYHIRENSGMHVLSERGDLEGLKVLIEAGAPVNGRDSNLCTPLHLAPSIEVAAQLISGGARLNLTDRWGRKAAARFQVFPALRDRLAALSRVYALRSADHALISDDSLCDPRDFVRKVGAMRKALGDGGPGSLFCEICETPVRRCIYDSVSDSGEPGGEGTRRPRPLGAAVCRRCGLVACHACSRYGFAINSRYLDKKSRKMKKSHRDFAEGMDALAAVNGERGYPCCDGCRNALAYHLGQEYSLDPDALMRELKKPSGEGKVSDVAPAVQETPGGFTRLAVESVTPGGGSVSSDDSSNSDNDEGFIPGSNEGAGSEQSGDSGGDEGVWSGPAPPGGLPSPPGGARFSANDESAPGSSSESEGVGGRRKHLQRLSSMEPGASR